MPAGEKARGNVAKDVKRGKSERARTMREAREAADRRGRMWNYAIGALVVIVVAGLVVLALSRERSEDVDIVGLQTYSDLSNTHTEGPVEYEHTPPAGGLHSSTLLNCGIYSEPIPNENVVHSLEHGAVWITYDPTLSDSDVAELRDFVEGLRQRVREYIVVSPYEGLPSPVAASAWERQVFLDGVDDERLRQFVDQFVRGTQSPEPGGPCTGGIGTPDA